MNDVPYALNNAALDLARYSAGQAIQGIVGILEKALF